MFVANRFFLGAAIFAIAATTSQAATLKVPGQFSTIQAAVDAAQSGDVILVKKGTYPEEVIVSGRSNLTIKRSGGGKATIESSGYIGAGLRLINSSNIRVAGMGFVGGDSEGIWLTSCDQVSIEKCRFDGNVDGVAVEVSSAVSIIQCKMVKMDGDGVYADASPDLLIERCRIFKVEGAAVYAKNCTGLTIQGNSVEAVDEGFYCNNTPGVMIFGNDIKNVFYDYAIDVKGDDVLISKNKVENVPDEPAIYVSGDRMSVTKNRVSATHDECGFDLHGDDFECFKNRVKKSDRGFDLSGSNGVFQKNRAEKCTTGMDLNIAGSSISKNRATKCDDYGMVIDGQGNTIDNNQSHKNGLYGFYVGDQGNELHDNKAKKNGFFDLRDFMSEGQNTYVGNKFGTIAIGGEDVK